MIHLGRPSPAICCVSTINQRPANTIPAVVTYDFIHAQHGIGWTPNTGSLIIQVTGLYVALFSGQITRDSGGGTSSVDFWSRVNGVNEVGSAFRTSISAPNDITMAASQEVHEYHEGDTVEMMQCVEFAGLGLGLTKFTTFDAGPLMPSCHFTLFRMVD